MNKFVKVLFASLLLPVALSVLACGKTEVPEEESTGTVQIIKAEDLVGTWKGTGDEISTVTFGANGSYLDDAGDGLYIKGTYRLDIIDDTITVYESEYGMTFTYDVTLSGDELTLQLSGGKPRTFIRQQ